MRAHDPLWYGRVQVIETWHIGPGGKPDAHYVDAVDPTPFFGRILVCPQPEYASFSVEHDVLRNPWGRK